jgi:hypothetical protein
MSCDCHLKITSVSYLPSHTITSKPTPTTTILSTTHNTTNRSGKTTQIPQFILEHELREKGGIRGHDTNIVVTQPRRVSAVSVAKRVSQERNESIGGKIGYQVRFESRKSNDTKVLFCKSPPPYVQ